MIGDNITIQAKYLETAAQLLPHLPPSDARICVAIGGESGSGKTVTALALKQLLDEKGRYATVLHQDDYFKLPPQTNHQARVANMAHIGVQEVDMLALQQAIDGFLMGSNRLIKPLIDYQANTILEETIALETTKILLLEGTYSMLLDNIALKIFIARNYHDTYQQRMARGRDEASAFIEAVLAIEHRLISPLYANADLIIQRDYSITKKEYLNP